MKLNWLRKRIAHWLLFDHEVRLKDLERHFVTKRDVDGSPIETLADIPVAQRKERQFSTRGMTMTQRKAMLEATDGGRKVG